MRALRILGACLLAVAVVACGGPDGDDPSDPTGPTTSFVESTEDRLPASFPADFPLPDDKTVVYSIDTGQDTAAYLKTGLPYEELKAFMIDRLPSAGWALVMCSETEPDPDAGVVTMMLAAGEDRTAQIVVGFINNANPDTQDYDFMVAVTHVPAATPLPSPSLDC